MASPSGMSAQLGLAKESTYGVYTAPVIFPAFLDESLKPDFGTIESAAIGRPGASRFAASARRKRSNQGAGGDLKFEVTESGMELLFEQLAGAVAISTPGGATLTRKKSYTPGDNPGSLTLQLGRPDTSSVVRPFTYLGARMASASLDVAVDGMVELSTTWDAKTEDTVQALASYVAPNPDPGVLTYVGSSLLIGGVAVDTTKIGVQWDNGLKTKRRFLGGVVRSPVAAGRRSVSVSFDTEFDSMTLYNLVSSGATASFVLTMAGSQIETGQAFRVILTLPAIQLDGDAPALSADDVTKLTLNGEALYDGTNPPFTIDYYTTV